MKVKLESIIEAIDFDTLESTNYLNLKTGEVVVIQEEALRDLEGDGLHINKADWWQHELAVTKAFLENPDVYLELPDKYEFHEYRVMQDFIQSIDNDRIRSKLEDEIRGKGAFQRFKNAADYHGVLDNWYNYKEQRLEAFVREWCKEMGVEIE